MKRKYEKHGFCVGYHHGKKLNLRYRIIIATKCRAKKKGIPFDLSVDDIKVPKVCPILGIKLNTNRKKASFDSPSIDRIKPSLGYIKGNVAIISYKANAIKSNATWREIFKVYKWTKRQARKNVRKTIVAKRRTRTC